MASCLGELHIWSLQGQTVISDQDIGCFTYHEKGENASPDHLYNEEKANFTEGRNITWTPRNKRPEKVKDTLKEVEDLLSMYRCVRCKWVSRRLLQMFLSNGTLVTFVVSIHTGDVDRIVVDKSLAGKLSSDSPSDVLLTDSFVLVVYHDKPKVDYFYFLRRPTGERKVEKLSSYDPKLLQLDLPGPVGRKLDRRLACNLHQDVVVCWWPCATGEAQPWSPLASDTEQANLVLLTVIGPKFDMLSYTRTDCDPIDVCYSKLQPEQILTIEQSSGPGGEIDVAMCAYECHRHKIQKMSMTTVPLHSPVVCSDRNLTEDKVLLGCEDGHIVLYDHYKKLTQMAVSTVVASLIRWHPSGTIAVVANSRGDIQVFDLALAPMMYNLVSESTTPSRVLQLAPYFRSPSALNQAYWSPLVDQPESRLPECNDSLFLMFERGPMVLLQCFLGILGSGILSPLALVNQYIKYRKLDEAISVLSGLNWNLEGQTCYACLSAIVIHLLRMPLNAPREGQLEAALGSFYAPPRPLSEVTVLEHRDPISRLARRFFHHLLRFARFEKAFLLAVDIGSRDLFMDLHYLARDKGETALSEVARRKASQIEAESLATDDVEDEEFSQGSEGSLTGSDDEYGEETPPPPRPPRRGVAGGPVSGGRGGAQPVTEPTYGGRGGAQPVKEPTYQNLVVDARFAPRSRRPLVSPADGALDHVIPPPQPWQQEPFMPMSEAAVQALEADLASHMADEFTEALMDEPIIPPPPSHADPPAQGHPEIERAASTVKVIHFGMV